MNHQLNIKKIRLSSLDAFRGLTVAAMILVNNPGSWANTYPPFKHAEWHGCTPTDLIFPFFLFISGVSISYAFGTQREDLSKHSDLIAKILRRTLILFGLGLLLALIPSVFTDPIQAFKTVRIPGVLQRIALVYCISALLFLKTDWKVLAGIFVGLLVLYWVLMTFVPVPGIGAPNLEKETNLGAWLDRLVLTEAHLWKSSRTWDPEGILGTLPAVATGLSGVLTGLLLRNQQINQTKKLGLMLAGGIFAVLCGLAWNVIFPINKALWTSSFVLFTSGLAIICLVLFYWVIDLKGYKSWATPFLAYGSNAITAYFTASLAAKILGIIKMTLPNGEKTSLKGWLYELYFEPYFSPSNASLAFALCFVLVWLIMLWWMYSRKIIIKI